MTNNYTELGRYFPVFARLRQLSKLQIFSHLLQSVLSSIKENSEGKSINIPQEMVTRIQEDARKQHRSNVSAALNEMKRTVGTWPKAEDHYTVQSKVAEIKSAIRQQIEEEEARLRRIHGYYVNIDSSEAMGMLNGVE